MAKNLIPGSPTKNGASPQAESIAVDLPPPETKRWIPRRKAAIVNAVHSGVVSLEEVCRRYDLSGEEFITWQRAIENHGIPGLRVTRLQIYRDAPSSRPGTGATECPAGAGNYVETL
jgi:transposase-like protein